MPSAGGGSFELERFVEPATSGYPIRDYESGAVVP